MIKARRESEMSSSFAKPNDFLQGMIDTANEHDGEPSETSATPSAVLLWLRLAFNVLHP